MKINGTCAIVTGGSSGIGKEVVKLIVARGGKVVIGDLDESGGNQLVKELNTTGKNAVFTKCNVINLEELKNLFKVGIKEFGSVQIMFNNAGTNESEDGINCEVKSTKLFNLLYTSVVQGGILANQHFQEQLISYPDRQFCIINTSSLSAIFPVGSFPIYSLCKRNVMDCTRILSQLGWPNVRINAIGPGFTRTNILTRDDVDNTEVIEEAFGLMEPSYIAEKMIELVENDNLNGVVRFVTLDKIHDVEPLDVELLDVGKL